MRTSTTLFSACLAALILTGCGGSGGGDSAAPTPPNGSSSSVSSSESSSSIPSSSSSSSSSSESSSSSSSSSADADSPLYTKADFPIGVEVPAAHEDFSLFTASDASARQDVISKQFSQLSADNIMKMNYLHPKEDTFTFDDADQLVSFAKSNGMTIHGHVLVWHSDYQVPEFMKNAGPSADWDKLISDHVKGIVSHFGHDVVKSWDVVNEAVDTSTSDGWRHSLFYNAYPAPAAGEIPQYIEVAFQAARDADSQVKLYYNDYDNTGNAQRLAKTLAIADDLKGKGLIDGVAFQMHIYMNYPSVNDVKNAFKQVVDRGLMVKISELDIPLVNPYGKATPPPEPVLTDAAAAKQKTRYCQVVKAYLDTVPAAQRGGITVWGLTDDSSWLMEQFRKTTGADYNNVYPLLYNADLTAKPAKQGVADALGGEDCQ